MKSSLLPLCAMPVAAGGAQSRAAVRAIRLGVQAKLSVGQPNDAYEREADAVADRVMALASHEGGALSAPISQFPAGRVQPLCRECAQDLASQEEERWLQADAGPAGLVAAPAGLEQRLQGLRGAGEALPDRTRARFESSFGADFATVRVHTGERAASLTRSIGARAFTVGRDVVFDRGEYAPDQWRGQHLLAHELTHVMQQRAAGGPVQLQRQCDPAALAPRTEPVFFPRQTTIMQMFAGTATLRRGSSQRATIGLIQQALVDLGYDLGAYGPNSDGVDRVFGPVTEQAVIAFQTDESVAATNAGEVDQATLKCLDEVRSHQTVPDRLVGTVPEDQFEVGGELRGGRDEDIFFTRGSAVLDAGDLGKIQRLAAAHRGCPLTLRGFISEDERIDFGDSLANSRIAAVDTAFANAGHNNAGVCNPAANTPLRTPDPQPGASGRVLLYQSRRKVEVVPPGATSTTERCCRDASDTNCVQANRPLDAGETTQVDAAITDGLALMTSAIDKLVVGNAEGDQALTSFFGTTSRRAQVRRNLSRWRQHIDTVVRTRRRRGTGCDGGCTGTIAYNQGTGSRANKTFCDPFFNPSIAEYPGLSAAQNRALILVHESGHGSLDTTDYAYDANRLIEFIGPSRLSLENTDSYVFLIRCLAGLPNSCAVAPRGDVATGLTAEQLRRAQEGVAWLESWLIWSGQDASNAYDTMDTSRTSGRWTNTYYEQVFYLLADAFDIRRPRQALPTMREQTTVAAIWQRLAVMERAAVQNLQINHDTSASPVQRWEPATNGPSDRLFLTDSYLSLTTPRTRVETLLPMIIEATPLIDSSLRVAYASFIRQTIRRNWSNQP